ncbi:hypothetical protein [Paracraurococcus ruber]|uniref:Uncharacterized protein n=1 Tax=Paracraurococcus ruber TaxID=77675 RepID=A0ABS1D371_9PROT|nr:hypothetical protein [Paracraurococcus ruber]MBK1660712.1 hypothetical protein [Paracraurococcus ruber]TDG28196.1 hypothetical protein E2C05_21060 [Paracraurococcus ruber]
MRRRGALILALLPAGAIGRPRPAPAQAAPRGEFWFDPTQLPSFTGTVERFLPNPRGETDGLIFREGPQIVFPPDIAEAVRQVAPPGRPLVAWGIRARGAPVITMLAFAAAADQEPRMVDRFYWRFGGRQPPEQARMLAVAGTVKQPYYAPQGEVAGAILEDGTVVAVPPGAADGVRDLLKAGAKLAAEGPGQEGEAGRALLARALGPAPDALKPIAPPPAR